mmetsp:Transcript_33462/g.83397  ORF Transcript_33462/g.83397 Transcript_33462/m.83397 type:complete len:403 (-) Transcript_33462:308-1516(-)
MKRGEGSPGGAGLETLAERLLDFAPADEVHEASFGASRRGDIEVHAPLRPPVATASGRASRLSASLGATSHERDELSQRAHVISFVANLALLAVKVFVYALSSSMAVLASLVDSAVDLAAQGMLMVANRLTSNEHDDRVTYPAGRSRLEPVGVVACALLMAMASAQVIRDAVNELLNARFGVIPTVELRPSDAWLLCATVVVKLALYVWCKMVYGQTHNVTIDAVATDNLNDVMSNATAVVAALLTQVSTSLWVSDPVGAIIISVYIIVSWTRTGMEQLEMIIGKSADPAFLDVVREMAETHDPAASLDVVRAYHFGPKFLVELEIVMPEETPLRESHDVGILLQHKIERLEEVDRCFVHVDYQFRDVDDHDPKTPIGYKTFEQRSLPPIAARLEMENPPQQ